MAIYSIYTLRVRVYGYIRICGKCDTPFTFKLFK
jgi:hypothetical protein